jgi:hypothetical protein
MKQRSSLNIPKCAGLRVFDMAEKNVLVVICPSYQTAEKAVHAFQAAPLKFQKVSVIGKDYFDVGSNPETTASSGKKSVPEEAGFWFRTWQMLSGDAFFKIDGIGPIIVSGPISETMREAGTNPKFFHACSPLRACMHAIGISTEKLHSCESALRSGQFLVVVYGSPCDIRAAENVVKICSTRKDTEGNQVNPDK